MEDIIKLIDIKITGHRRQLTKSDNSKQKLQEIVVEAKNRFDKKPGALLETAAKVFETVERINFHKAAIVVLEDLKKELTNGQI